MRLLRSIWFALRTGNPPVIATGIIAAASLGAQLILYGYPLIGCCVCAVDLVMVAVTWRHLDS